LRGSGSICRNLPVGVRFIEPGRDESRPYIVGIVKLSHYPLRIPGHSPVFKGKKSQLTEIEEIA
jgi:hypothetical protein